MKMVLKKLLKNSQSPISNYPTKDRDRYPSKTHLKPRDIPQEEARQILFMLNSLNSTDQLEKVTNQYAKKKILTNRDVQRIIHMKVELREFQNLQQVACVPRIGAEKFDTIVRALGNHVVMSP